MRRITLHPLELRMRSSRTQTFGEGYLQPLVGPLERIVVAIDGPGNFADQLPQGEARPEAVAVLLRRQGAQLEWGDPLPRSAGAAEQLAFERGRSSIEIIRANPALLSELQLGAWFNVSWRGRLLRRLLVRVPRGVTLLRLVVRRPIAMRLALDVWFWAGVRSRATRREWQRYTQSSYVALCYHEVSPARPTPRSDLTVSSSRFRAHMRLLGRLGYQPLSPEELMRFHRDPTAVLPRRRYVLTADDGYVGTVDAFEQSRGARPLCFVITAFAAREGSLPTGVSDASFAAWPRILAAAREGVGFGSHSRNHRPLDECDDHALEGELGAPRADFEAAGLAPPVLVAYPYGRHDHRVRRAALDAGYALAFTTRPGRNAAGTDPGCLRRIPIEQDDGRLVFIWKLVTGEARPAVFQAAHDRRRRRATSAEGLTS